MNPAGSHDDIRIGDYTLINYVAMTPELSRQVWVARNHAVDPLPHGQRRRDPLADHERFVASLGSRDDVGYYAVMHGGEFIGSVNLHYSESGEVERGIYLHPTT